MSETEDPSLMGEPPQTVDPTPPEPTPETPPPSNKPKKLLIVDGQDPVEVELTEQEIADLVINEPIYYRPISRRQLRLWLFSNGIRDNHVRQAIAAIEDENIREAATIEWEDSTIYERNHPLITQIGVALGFTEEQINQGFLTAINL